MVLQKGIFLSGRRMLAGDGEVASPLLLPPGIGKELRPWEQMLSSERCCHRRTRSSF